MQERRAVAGPFDDAQGTFRFTVDGVSGAPAFASTQMGALIEAVLRKPLSLRFREVANVVGVALVLSLMLFALKNDVMRKILD